MVDWLPLPVHRTLAIQYFENTSGGWHRGRGSQKDRDFQVVTDPAFLVTRTMEDFVTWVDTSKLKRKVMKYNDKLDDFDLLE